ncbi:hypothetical protein [Erythrobacter sp.]|uniref:hypothetical protein n=1 Tax=Erythrobacter sp. TaxID=1042 RepID=UPI001425FCA2|nr:hypothetical protein [Erythrobacter sp.]QIQ85230.1 MAG: hypothetical protein G9473_00430 [Erythrobacter sp.]
MADSKTTHTGADGATHIDDDAARAGTETGRVRWILIISTLIAIVAMSIAWIVPALQEGDVESAELATERVDEMREDGVAEEDIPAVPTTQPSAPESTVEEPVTGE